jgi:hypothetical protein
MNEDEAQWFCMLRVPGVLEGKCFTVGTKEKCKGDGNDDGKGDRRGNDKVSRSSG